MNTRRNKHKDDTREDIINATTSEKPNEIVLLKNATGGKAYSTTFHKTEIDKKLKC